MTSNKSAIACDPEILSGIPVFCGTRVPFQALLDYLEGGQTLDDFLADFPTVTREAAVRAIQEAKASVADETHFRETVDAGIAAANRGEFVEHQEVKSRLNQILKS
jgi:uncharacterized protein (DUF433 family)